MTSMSVQSIASGSRNPESSSLPDPTSHQLSKRQQYDALLDAEAHSSSATSLGSPSSHPSFPAVAPLCQRYPTQASAIFQAYLDLKNGAAAWEAVEPIALASQPDDVFADAETDESSTKDLSTLSDADAEALVQQKLNEFQSGISKLGLVNDTNDDDLTSTGIAAIKGRRKDAKAYEIVIPLTIAQHLRASQLSAIFELVEKHAASCPPGEEVDTSHVLLAIIAPDSTLVYYLVSQGMVKPIN